MIETMFIEQHYLVRKVLQFSELSASSYYYRRTNVVGKKGVKPSEYTPMFNGPKIPNSIVVSEIKKLLGKEFVDYDHLKVTYHLQDELGY